MHLAILNDMPIWAMIAVAGAIVGGAILGIVLAKWASR